MEHRTDLLWSTPPADQCPESVRPLLEAREAAEVEYDEYRNEHSDLINSGWETRALERDRKAAYDAEMAGEPEPKESYYARAVAARPGVIGKYDALFQKLLRADKPLRAALVDAAPAAADALRDPMDEAGRVYVEAEAAYIRARAALARLANLRLAWRQMSDTREDVIFNRGNRLPALGGEADMNKLSASAVVNRYARFFEDSRDA